MRECEELLMIVQRNRDSWLDLASGSRLQAARMMHMCQACQKLKSRASCCTTGQKSQAGQAVCSRLELVTQPSREVKSPEHAVWEKLTFHISSHPTIYIPLEQLHQSLQKIPSILHKKLNFSILLHHFYKTSTSVYLLYTFFLLK